MTSTFAAADVLAKSGEAAKSGPLGFAIILVLCVACYFLFKSMSRHLKRVREDFPKGPAGALHPPAATRPGGTDQASTPPAPPAATKATDPEKPDQP